MRMRSRSRRPHASLALGTMEETTDDEAAGYRPRPCSGLRQELLECLRESDCVKVVNGGKITVSMAGWRSAYKPRLFL